MLQGPLVRCNGIQIIMSTMKSILSAMMHIRPAYRQDGWTLLHPMQRAGMRDMRRGERTHHHADPQRMCRAVLHSFGVWKGKFVLLQHNKNHGRYHPLQYRVTSPPEGKKMSVRTGYHLHHGPLKNRCQCLQRVRRDRWSP